MKAHQIDDRHWWRMNKLKNATFTIEWTAKEGGVVRAKLDSISDWEYRPCKDVRFAKDIGYTIIDKQANKRQIIIMQGENNNWWEEQLNKTFGGYQGA